MKFYIAIFLFNAVLFVDSTTIPKAKQVNIHEISVKAIIGDIMKFKMNEDQSVEELKRLILENTDIPIERQILFFKGKKLEDCETLRLYKMDKKVTVELFLRYF